MCLVPLSPEVGVTGFLRFPGERCVCERECECVCVSVCIHNVTYQVCKSEQEEVSSTSEVLTPDDESHTLHNKSRAIPGESVLYEALNPGTVRVRFSKH